MQLLVPPRLHEILVSQLNCKTIPYHEYNYEESNLRIIVDGNVIHNIFLNKNDMVWVNAVDHFGRAYGTVNQEQTEINITADTDGIYNVLLVGTRKDPTVLRHFKGVEIKK